MLPNRLKDLALKCKFLSFLMNNAENSFKRLQFHGFFFCEPATNQLDINFLCCKLFFNFVFDNKNKYFIANLLFKNVGEYLI